MSTSPEQHETSLSTQLNQMFEADSQTILDLQNRMSDINNGRLPEADVADRAIYSFVNENVDELTTENLLSYERPAELVAATNAWVEVLLAQRFLWRYGQAFSSNQGKKAKQLVGDRIIVAQLTGTDAIEVSTGGGFSRDRSSPTTVKGTFKHYSPLRGLLQLQPLDDPDRVYQISLYSYEQAEVNGPLVRYAQASVTVEALG